MFLKKLFLVAASAALFSACSVMPSGNAASAAPEVAAAAERLRIAMIDPTAPALGALVADDLSYGHSSGKVQNKDQFIADLETHTSAFKTLEMQNQTITLQGDTALVRNHFHALAVNSGVEVPTDIDNFQVWQKQKGKWLLIGRQAYKY